MPDPLDALFDQMRGVHPPAPFSAPDQVRRLGQQRTHRHRLAVGGAVLAVAASTAGVGAAPVLLGDHPPKPRPTIGTDPSTGSPSVSPPVAPPVSSSPTGIRQGLLITQADLGPGNWRPFSAEIFTTKDLWRWAEICPAYRSDRFPSLRHQASVDKVAYRNGNEASAFEILERYADGWGPRNLDDVRAVIGLCATATAPPSPDEAPPPRQTVMANGFAGDDSLLLKQEVWSYDAWKSGAEPLVTYYAVVRVGDRVATVWSTINDAGYVRALAGRAAARLG
jgi:hypothetical protein